MTIPDYQTIMLPLLEFASDGEEHHLSNAVNKLAQYFQLNESDLEELLPSGSQTVFRNRVSWANTYLKKAKLLQSTRRGYFAITPRGYDVLEQEPEYIDNTYLKQFEEFIDFKSNKAAESDTQKSSDHRISENESTPQETIEAGYKQIRQELEDQLLERVMELSPTKFERLVVDLLTNMGYGTGKTIGRSGDGGIDGVINEDKLGLDVVYIQAKRWEGTVGRPEIQKFAGALQGRRARKGVFITTSDYSREAYDYVEYIDSKIVLINGHLLAQYMIDHNVGVSIVETYHIKQVDSDYFDTSL